MSATDWSGLAPAVDAYLARWAEVRRTGPLLAHLLGTGPHPNRGRPIIVPDTLNAWIRFGTTYGLPQPDGTVKRGLALSHGDEVIREGEAHDARLNQAAFAEALGDGGPGGPVIMQEGATIQGAEQLHDPSDGDVLTGAWLAERERQMLEGAIPHYVSAAVVAEVSEAVVSMEPEPLFHTDLITPHGFAVFEQPFVVSDLHPRTGLHDPRIRVGIRALGWYSDAKMMASDGTIVQGVTLFSYSTPGDQLDLFLPTVTKAMQADGLLEGDDDYVDMAMVFEGMNQRQFLASDVVPWGFGRQWGIRDQAAHIPGTVPTPVAELRRWFLAFMRLCWQEVIVRHPADAPRHDRRRWERARPRMNDLTVLRLRRHTAIGGAETGTGAQLGYRVKVRGFWRRQYFPSLGAARLPDGSMNPESHRLIWIEPHWRGPEDGPIHVTIPATAVVR